MSDAEFDKTQILSPPATGAPSTGPRGVLRCVDISVLNDPGGMEIKLVSGEVTLGRGAENVVALNAHGISRNHARLFLENGAWQVEDLGSTNGTRVNNSQVEKAALADGDTIAFGRVCYKFHTVDPQAGTSSMVDLDLGSAEQTMVMSPTPRAPKPPPAPPAPPPTAEPGAEQVYDTGKRKRVTAAPARSGDSGGNTGLIIAVVVAVIAAAGGAAYFLGYL